MPLFIIEGLPYTGTLEVARKLQAMTGFDLIDLEKLDTSSRRTFPYFGKQSDEQQPRYLLLWKALSKQLKVNKKRQLILHRPGHPYILHQLSLLEQVSTVHTLACACSAYKRFARRGTVTGNFSTQFNDDQETVDNFNIFNSCAFSTIETDSIDDRAIGDQLAHILFVTKVPNIESHIRDNPSD